MQRGRRMPESKSRILDIDGDSDYITIPDDWDFGDINDWTLELHISPKLKDE